jgi:hypothetical protein
MAVPALLIGHTITNGLRCWRCSINWETVDREIFIDMSYTGCYILHIRSEHGMHTGCLIGSENLFRLFLLKFQVTDSENRKIN